MLLASLGGCASPPPPAPATRDFRFEIPAGRFAEECFQLTERERIEYRFDATQTVDFNLHTHRGGEIVTPVDVKRTRAQSGTFASPRAEEYCMTWTNANAVPTHITGEWRRLP
jgi:hypothetical protein